MLFAPVANASRFGMMHMSDAQERELAAWVESLELYAAPTAYTPGTGSVSVLDHFHYTPGLRDQTPTGTCWIWASTAIMSMYFDKQFSGNPVLQEGLSVQFLASNAWMVGSNLNAGGHFGMTKAFYDMIGYAIPYSNIGAAWDTTFSVGEVRPSLIASGTSWRASGNTAFPIAGIDLSQVDTWDISQTEAIRNLKSVLDAGYPVGLLYFLPTTADWDIFDAFWANEPATSIINMDYAKDHTWDKGGCGHWTVLVGYNDTDSDPAKHYWTMLNTHGTVDGTRPDATFRMAMNIDYSAQFTGNPDPIHNLYLWVVMDTTFAPKNSPLPAKGLESVALTVDNSLPSAVSSVVVSGVGFSAVPAAIVLGKLTLNFLEIPVNADTGSWSQTSSEFRFVSKSGADPYVTLSINRLTRKWSASVRGTTLARKISSSDGLVAKFEYAIAPGGNFTLLSQSAAVADQVKTKASAAVKGP
jgi:hypothetical protein